MSDGNAAVPAAAATAAAASAVTAAPQAAAAAISQPGPPPPQPKLPGQYAALARELAKSGGRNILLWIAALVVLWWTVELYAMSTSKNLKAAGVELDRASQSLGRLVKAQQELNVAIDKHNKAKKAGKIGDQLPADQLNKTNAAIKALGDEIAKETPKLEAARQAFEKAKQPEHVDFKSPVPGTETFRLPYSVAPIVWAGLLVGVFAYICTLRWRVFEFALRAFRTPAGAANTVELDDTLAPAPWWMFPVPLVEAPGETDRLRHLFGVGLSARSQYPLLLCLGVAALLALHFRVNQLAQDVHALVNPVEAAISNTELGSAYVSPRVNARRMDNSPEALAPILSKGLLALNLSLALWWLWPRKLRSVSVPQLEPVFTRRTAIGLSAPRYY